MSFRDLGAIFNRTFIIGFFVPAAVGTVGVAAVQYRWHTQTYLDDTSKQDLVLYATLISLGVGLLAQGLWNPIVVYLFQGYVHEARGGIRYYVTWPGYRLLLFRHTRRFDRLRAQRDDEIETPRTRAWAAWQLDRRYPGSHDRVLPTAFGNATRASEDYIFGRWGLDYAAIWPRIETLLNEEERVLLDEGDTEVAFFVNLSLVSFLIAVVSVAWVASNYDSAALAVVGGCLLTMLFFNYLAVEAAIRLGQRVRAAVDLHRLAMYRGLGLSVPAAFEQERGSLAVETSQFLLYGSGISPGSWDAARGGKI
jgi:hypothetical protein